mmetsp:Transcript_111058/g.358260  ORF Transcript_111058/g.358260 Transcript_111058/m.358260 type:complete len:316 (+) Transcript_111058:166-1113(+)
MLMLMLCFCRLCIRRDCHPSLARADTVRAVGAAGDNYSWLLCGPRHLLPRMWMSDVVSGFRAEMARLGNIHCAHPVVEEDVVDVQVGNEAAEDTCKMQQRSHAAEGFASEGDVSTMDGISEGEADVSSDSDVLSRNQSKDSDVIAAPVLDLDLVGKKRLFSTLASVLKGLIAQTEARSTNRNHRQGTSFHSMSAPSISIGDYFVRLSKFNECTDEVFILAMIYLDRLTMMHPDIGINRLSVHRLLSTAVVLAAKFHDDDFRGNDYYAKVAGVSLAEMNKAEEEFLWLLGWQLTVRSDEYNEYLRTFFPDTSAHRV